MPRFYLDLRAHRDAAAQGQTPFTPAIAVVYQVDEGLRLMQRGGRRRDLRPPRGVRRGGAGRARRARLRAVRRPAPRLAHGHRGARPGRPRLEGVQRRGQAPRRRPGRRPGQADRQDLPRSATSARSRSRRSSARSHTLELVSLAAGPAGRARRGRGGRPARGPGQPGHRRPAGRCRHRRVRVLVAESVAREGIELLARAPRGRRAPRLHARGAGRAPARLRRAHRPQPGPGRRRAHRRRARASSSSAGPASASTTSTSTPRRGPASPSSTRRPATRSRPPSTRSRCSTASPGGPRPPTRASAAASGSAPSSPASSCAAGRSGSSAWARSARPSPSARGPWRWSSSAATRS